MILFIGVGTKCLVIVDVGMIKVAQYVLFSIVYFFISIFVEITRHSFKKTWMSRLVGKSEEVEERFYLMIFTLYIFNIYYILAATEGQLSSLLYNLHNIFF
jgi:hypothetical protein